MAIEKLSVILELITGNYKKEAREAATATSQIGNSARQAGTSASTGFNLMRTAVVGLVGSGLVRWGRDAVDSLARIERIGAQTDAALRSTAGAANVTREEIDRMAGSLENLTSVEAESITEGQNLLLTFTNIRNEVGAGNDIFDQTTKAMVDLSVAMGQSIPGAAVLLGKAINDPIKGLTALTRAGVQFTEAQKTQIRSFVEANDVMSAQKIILEELNVQFGGSAEALGDTLTGRIELAKHAFGTMGESIAAGLLPPLEDLIVRLTDVFDVLGPMSAAAADAKATLAQLAVEGFDLVALKSEAAAFALREAFEGMGFANDPTERMAELLSVLNGELDLSVAEWTDLRNILVSSHDQLGLNEAEMAVLIARIDEYRGVIDPAVAATRRYQAAQKDAATATRDHTGALQEQRDLLREMTDPLFALIAANDRYESAQRTLNDALIEGGTRSDEYQDALTDLLIAQRDLTQAQADANVVGSSGLNLLRQLAIQAGINEDAFDRWAASVDNLAGSIANLPSSIGTVNTITGNPNRPGAFHSGGIVPGPRGMERLAVVQAGEGIIPLSQMSGGALPGVGDVSTVVSAASYLTKIGGNVIVMSPSNNQAQDLQYGALLANHATFGKF